MDSCLLRMGIPSCLALVRVPQLFNGVADIIKEHKGRRSLALIADYDLIV